MKTLVNTKNNLKRTDLKKQIKNRMKEQTFAFFWALTSLKQEKSFKF